jgi:hypothetical protein
LADRLAIIPGRDYFDHLTILIVGSHKPWPCPSRGIPENINFAVNAELARALLDKHGIKYDSTEASEPLATPALAERALKYTALVQCYR